MSVTRKYRNRKITKDGETFDSIKEYRRWCELKLLERAGKIVNLQRQVRFTLIPAQYETVKDEKTGKLVKGKCLERECAYIADFVYMDKVLDTGVVEDTKGFRTKDYVIKRKLMLHNYGVRISEV